VIARQREDAADAAVRQRSNQRVGASIPSGHSALLMLQECENVSINESIDAPLRANL
jgi:hypothetical protein